MRTRISVLIGAVLLAGCGGGGSAEPTTSSPSVVPSSAAPAMEAVLYYVADVGGDLRLFPEKHPISSEVDPALARVQALIADKPIDPDYTSLWYQSAKVTGVTIADGVATVDFGDAKLNVGSQAEARAIEEIVWTLTEGGMASAVRFTVNGKAVESLAGHVDTTGEFTRQPDYEVLSSVTIESLVDGSTLTNPVMISGMACTFEANVAWELLQDGAPIKSGSTIAGEACPVRSPWQQDLGQLVAGDYTFRAYELSMKDGSLVSEDTKNFSVQ